MGTESTATKWWTPSASTPIRRYTAFPVFVAMYGVLMMFFVLRSATASDPTVLTFQSFLVPFTEFFPYLFITVVVLLLVSFDVEFHTQCFLTAHLGSYYRSGVLRTGSIPLIAVFYIVICFIAIPEPLRAVQGGDGLNPLPVVVVIQGMILLVMVGVSSVELLPQHHFRNLSSKASFLETHLTQWWRLGQLYMSFFFAFGIGIAATAYLQANPPDVAIHVITSLIGIGYLAWFAHIKSNVVIAEVRRCYELYSEP